MEKEKQNYKVVFSSGINEYDVDASSEEEAVEKAKDDYLTFPNFDFVHVNRKVEDKYDLNDLYHLRTMCNEVSNHFDHENAEGVELQLYNAVIHVIDLIDGVEKKYVSGAVEEAETNKQIQKEYRDRINKYLKVFSEYVKDHKDDQIIDLTRSAGSVVESLINKAKENKEMGEEKKYLNIVMKGQTHSYKEDSYTEYECNYGLLIIKRDDQWIAAYNLKEMVCFYISDKPVNEIYLF